MGTIVSSTLVLSLFLGLSLGASAAPREDPALRDSEDDAEAGDGVESNEEAEDAPPVSDESPLQQRCMNRCSYTLHRCHSEAGNDFGRDLRCRMAFMACRRQCMRLP